MRLPAAFSILATGILLGGCAEPTNGAAPGTGGTQPTANSFLAGLFQVDPSTTGPGASGAAKPLEQASLDGGDIVVAGPPGYCVDRRTLRSRSSRSFAVIASCYILSGGRTGEIVAPVIVTVTTGRFASGDDLPGPDSIAAEIGAPLIGQYDRDGVRLAHLTTGGDVLLPGSDPRHWRGAFLHGDRIVGLALYAPEGHPILSGDRGGTLLRAVRARIGDLSPDRGTATATTVAR